MITLKPFLVFVIEDFYPSGGFDDLEGSYDTLDEAILKGESLVGLDNRIKIYKVNEQDNTVELVEVLKKGFL